MSEHSDKMIAQAQEKLRAVEQQVVDLKRFINQVRVFDGQPPLYTEEAMTPSAANGQIRSDQFYGRPLATVVREILELRKTSNLGAATVAEIYAVMAEGGYGFETSNDENAKRGLRISLAKNPAFHKLPNGRYGLSDWYPAASKARRTANERQAEEQDDAQDAEQQEAAAFKTDDQAEEAVAATVVAGNGDGHTGRRRRPAK